MAKTANDVIPVNSRHAKAGSGAFAKKVAVEREGTVLILSVPNCSFVSSQEVLFREWETDCKQSVMRDAGWDRNLKRDWKRLSLLDVHNSVISGEHKVHWAKFIFNDLNGELGKNWVKYTASERWRQCFYYVPRDSLFDSLLATLLHFLKTLSAIKSKKILKKSLIHYLQWQRQSVSFV